MKKKSNPSNAARNSRAPLIWGALLLAWLVVQCIVPDPRPFGAPEWAVGKMQSMLGVSESTARVVATILLQGAGIGVIGVLLALAMKHVPARRAAPMILIAAPLLAIVTKWINFGFFPITPQLRFIVAVAILGGLAGLALRHSRAALVGMVILAVGLFVWGTSTGIKEDLYAAARVTAQHVLDHANTIPEGEESFAGLMEMAFAYAEVNSRGADAILSNQAAILALGVILGEDRVASVAKREVDLKRKDERVALRNRIGIRGRRDLSQHFWVSAALVVLSDAQRALTVGIAKEMKDSTPGGSGFSFVDLVADKAGIRFAIAATRDARSARSLQRRVANGVVIDDFFPDFSDLPEGLSRDTFQSEFGGVGGAETLRLFDEIDLRLDALEVFQ